VEDRPYWLDTVLVRYDNEALNWVRRMQQFDAAATERARTGKLPESAAMGIVLP